MNCMAYLAALMSSHFHLLNPAVMLRKVSLVFCEFVTVSHYWNDYLQITSLRFNHWTDYFMNRPTYSTPILKKFPFMLQCARFQVDIYDAFQKNTCDLLIWLFFGVKYRVVKALSSILLQVLWIVAQWYPDQDKSGESCQYFF